MPCEPTIEIGICHQNVRTGDAIGHDIDGMYQLLDAMGFEVSILCDYVDDDTLSGRRVLQGVAGLDPAPCHVLIYHHSVHWEAGAALLERFHGPLALRYHNVTPAHFFAPYAPAYTEACESGRRQTRDLATRHGRAIWLADSEYNRQELISLGVHRGHAHVVPPFNRLQLAQAESGQQGESGGGVEVLFVGRFAPNKGHEDLVRILDAYVTQISPDIVLHIVGGRDPSLRAYHDEIDALIARLDLGSKVRIHAHVNEGELHALYRRCHVFLCASHHEGFCVPVIEAQAHGLPVVSVNTTALAETAGPQQLVAEPITDARDYLFYARLIEAACANADLRRTLIDQGLANVQQRFTNELIGNRFLDALLPLLLDASTDPGSRRP